MLFHISPNPLQVFFDHQYYLYMSDGESTGRRNVYKHSKLDQHTRFINLEPTKLPSVRKKGRQVCSSNDINDISIRIPYSWNCQVMNGGNVEYKTVNHTKKEHTPATSIY